jgi:hypothetical protein
VADPQDAADAAESDADPRDAADAQGGNHVLQVRISALEAIVEAQGSVIEAMKQMMQQQIEAKVNEVVEERLHAHFGRSSMDSMERQQEGRSSTPAAGSVRPPPPPRPPPHVQAVIESPPGLSRSTQPQVHAGACKIDEESTSWYRRTAIFIPKWDGPEWGWSMRCGLCRKNMPFLQSHLESVDHKRYLRNYMGGDEDCESGCKNWMQGSLTTGQTFGIFKSLEEIKELQRRGPPAE